MTKNQLATLRPGDLVINKLTGQVFSVKETLVRPEGEISSVQLVAYRYLVEGDDHWELVAEAGAEE